MSNPITPRRIEWAGPSGYKFILDEDGVNLHPGRNAIEPCELDALLEVIAEARRCHAQTITPTPQPQPREEYRAAATKYAAERVVRLVDKAINADCPPF